MLRLSPVKPESAAYPVEVASPEPVDRLALAISQKLPRNPLNL